MNFPLNYSNLCFSVKLHGYSRLSEMSTMIYQYRYVEKLIFGSNTLQFTTCKYNCIMPRVKAIVGACGTSTRQNLLSRKASSSDHSSLVQMLVIFDLIQIFSIPRLMKWVINENSISRYLVCLPFNQIYTAKVVVTTHALS